MFWNPGIDWNQALDTTVSLMQQMGGVLPPDHGYL
jgi:hypothetical protein